jgi:hypothetical protein
LYFASIIKINLKIIYIYLIYLIIINRIDQINDEDDIIKVYKAIKAGKRLSKENYIKASSRCSNLLKEYIINSKKTSIVKDINDLMKKEYNDEKEKTIIQFSLSQKKIIYNHFKLFRNQLIKEFKNDIFGSLKSNYI